MKTAIPIPAGQEKSANCPSRLAPILTPLFLLVVGSVVFRFSDLDLFVERWFWSAEGRWRFENWWLVTVLYGYGTLPALLVAAGGLVVWVASFFVFRLKPTRTFGGFLALAMILGPGLLINATLKDHYGRPRPRQVAEFGGRRTNL